MAFKTGRWTPEEQAFLRQNYDKLTPMDLREHLNRHGLSIAGEANRLGLIEKKARKKKAKGKTELPPPPAPEPRKVDPEADAIDDCLYAINRLLADDAAAIRRVLNYLTERLLPDAETTKE